MFSCTLGYRQIDKRLTAKIGEVFCGTFINIGIGTKGTSDVEMWTNAITVQNRGKSP